MIKMNVYDWMRIPIKAKTILKIRIYNQQNTLFPSFYLERKEKKQRGNSEKIAFLSFFLERREEKKEGNYAKTYLLIFFPNWDDMERR